MKIYQMGIGDWAQSSIPPQPNILKVKLNLSVYLIILTIIDHFLFIIFK